MKNWLSAVPLQTIYSWLPNDLKQKSTPDFLQELDVSSKKDYARKRFYKLNLIDNEVLHLTYGCELDKQYENSRVLYQTIPAFACKPLFIKTKDQYSLFGQEFFEGQAIDYLYNESKIEEDEVTKILTKIFKVFQRHEQPSTTESAQEEFKGFCETILDNNLFAEIDFQILEKEVFPLISSWIEKANLTVRWSQGDLSARNILVNEQKDFKIIDCEFASKTHFHQEDWLRLGNFSKGKFCEHPFVAESLKKSTLSLELIHLLKQTYLNRRVHILKDYEFYLKKDLFYTLYKTTNFEKFKSFFLQSIFTYYNVLNISLDEEISFNESLRIENNSLNEFKISSEKEIFELRNQVVNFNQQIDEIKEQVACSEAEILKLSDNSLELQIQLEQRENKIFRMQNSFSWKITAPIRFLRRQKEKLFELFTNLKGPVDIKENPVSSKLRAAEKPFEIFSPFESEENYPNPSNTKKIHDPNCLKIIWLIPDFGKGSGGHSNIFRMIHFLEKFGHKNSVLICGETHHGSTEKTKKVICNNFFKIDADVHCLLNPKDFNQDGDALVCTSYDTCYYGRSVPFNGKRFYFVQDYEPDFSPKGSYYHLAKATYGFGLECITNGKWMAEKVVSEGGKCAGWFQQAFDPLHYYPSQSKNYQIKKVRIAAYIRFGTPRRLSELIVFALNILAKERNDFEVMFFGDNHVPLNVHFPNKILGVLQHSKLGELYRSCDIGCVFSGTNYSLIPIEMMAAGLPVIEFDGENIRSTFPEETISLAKPDPENIKEVTSSLISNPERRKSQAEEAISFVKNFSWRSSAKSVEKAFLNVISSQNES
jgi:glycosyltransferase involved in cell wall biosynthesis